MNFKVISSDILLEGRVFDVRRDFIEYDSGNQGRREIAVHNGGSVVVPVTAENKLVLVSQYRYPVGQTLLEFPAGKLEKGEDPAVCAARELTEETGYTAGTIDFLGGIFTTPGFCTEILYMYLATGLTPGEHRREEGEAGMQVIELPFDELEARIAAGAVKDAKTISGYTMARLRLAGNGHKR